MLAAELQGRREAIVSRIANIDCGFGPKLSSASSTILRSLVSGSPVLPVGSCNRIISWAAHRISVASSSENIFLSCLRMPTDASIVRIVAVRIVAFVVDPVLVFVCVFEVVRLGLRLGQQQRPLVGNLVDHPLCLGHHAELAPVVPQVRRQQVQLEASRVDVVQVPGVKPQDPLAVPVT
jgi:hypothetical protein